MAAWMLGKNVHVPTCVALCYILHYTRLNGIYFSLEYCGAPFLSPICLVYGPILPFTLVRELDCERLVVHISQLTSCQTPSARWVHVPYPQIFWCDQS